MGSEVHEGKYNGHKEPEGKVEQFQLIQKGLAHHWRVGGIHNYGRPDDGGQVECRL